jgi:hypothetical protein
MQRGGHFAALEEPQMLVSDIRVFVGSLAATTFTSPLPPAAVAAALEERKVLLTADEL